MNIEHYDIKAYAIRDIPVGVSARDLASVLYALGTRAAHLTNLVKHCETRTFDLEFVEGK